MNPELKKLSKQIGRLDPSPARLALLEEAVRLADTLQDVENGYSFRETMIEEAIFGGRPEVALVAFGWCLAQCDRDPESFPEDELLWQYKWVVSHLPEFPRISLGQIQETVADMARRFERNGVGKRAVHHILCRIACETGDEEAARRELPLWKKTRRDSMSDCLACETNATVQSHLFFGEDEEAVKVAQPILKGKQECAEIPQGTLGLVLEPLVRLGRIDEAIKYHERGYRMVRGKMGFIHEIAQHIRFALIIDQPVTAAKIFERHLPLALSVTSPSDRFEFFKAALFLFRQLAKLPKFRRKLALPESFPHHDPKGKPDLAALRDWFETETRTLAREFDARNGNDFRTREVDALADLESLIQTATSEEDSDPS